MTISVPSAKIKMIIVLFVNKDFIYITQLAVIIVHKNILKNKLKTNAKCAKVLAKIVLKHQKIAYPANLIMYLFKAALVNVLVNIIINQETAHYVIPIALIAKNIINALPV